MRLILTLFILFSSLLYSKTVYTKSIKRGNYIDIYLINKNLFDITIKYNARYENVILQKKLPIIKTIKSQSKNKLLTIKIQNKNFKYSSNYQWTLGNNLVNHNYNYLYRLPYKLRKSVKVTQGFNGSFSHKGSSKYAVDFNLKVGEKIYAARDGIVVKIKQDSNKGGKSRAFLKYANYIIIKHSDGTYAKYNHLKKNSSFVNVGDYVNRGDLIALSGNTGFSSGPHLHFIVFQAKDYKSRYSLPIKFISKEGIIINPKVGKSYTAVQ